MTSRNIANTNRDQNAVQLVRKPVHIYFSLSSLDCKQVQLSIVNPIQEDSQSKALDAENPTPYNPCFDGSFRLELACSQRSNIYKQMDASPNTISSRRDTIHTHLRFSSKVQSDPIKQVHSSSTASPYTLTETYTSILRCLSLKRNLFCHVDNALNSMVQLPFLLPSVYL